MVFLAFALLLPQAAQAHGGAQLPGFGLLATGHGEGLLETPFRLFYDCRLWTVDFGLERKLALQPIQLRLILTFLSFVYCFQRLGHYVQPFSSLAPLPIRLSQQGKHIRPSELCSRGPMDGEALTHLGNPLFLSLLSQRPAPKDGPPGSHERKPLLGRKANDCLCTLLSQ